MKKSRFSDSQLLAILKQAESGTPDPDYMVPRRACCLSISRYTAVSRVGGFVERSHIKAFVDTIGALREWVRRNGRADGSFSKEWGFCNPLRRLRFSHDTL